MDEIVRLLPQGGAWTILIVVLLLIFGPLQIFSKEGAEKLWLIGRISRWITQRQERSVERERQIKRSTVEDLRADLAALRADLDAEQARSQKREEESRKREDMLQALLNESRAYIVYLTAWAREAQRMAAEYGWHPPMKRLKNPEEHRDDPDS